MLIIEQLKEKVLILRNAHLIYSLSTKILCHIFTESILLLLYAYIFQQASYAKKWFDLWVTWDIALNSNQLQIKISSLTKALMRLFLLLFNNFGYMDPN